MLRIKGLIARRRIITRFRVRRGDAGFDLSGIDVPALIDTGATVSGLATSVVRSLGLPMKSKAPLGSVRGEEQVARYVFGLGIVDGAFDGDQPAPPFFFEDVVGFEFTDSLRFDVLIGMDILEQCDLTVGRSGEWALSFGR